MIYRFFLTSSCYILLSSALDAVTYGYPPQQPSYDIKMRKEKAPSSYSNDFENQELERSNEEILNDVQNVIKSSYKGYMINIHVYDGNVKLSGNVHSDQDKKGIEDRVSKVKGVRSVKNQIQVITNNN